MSEAECSSGTRSESSEKSWLPVPRRPETFQVSCTSTSLAGKSMKRMSGAPLGASRRPSPSSTRLPPISQSQCWTPEPKRQRPLTV